MGQVERMGDNTDGVAVYIGASVVAQAIAGEILVPRTVVDLVAGSGFFAVRG